MNDFDTYIEDEQGKLLLILNKNGEIAVSRFPDMPEETKNMVVQLYAEMTGQSENNIRDFLDYTSDENEFCS